MRSTLDVDQGTGIHDASEAYLQQNEQQMSISSVAGMEVPKMSRIAKQQSAISSPQACSTHSSEQGKATLSAHLQSNLMSQRDSQGLSATFTGVPDASSQYSSPFHPSTNEEKKKLEIATMRSRSSRKTGKNGLSILQSRDVWLPSGWSGRFLSIVVIEAIIVIAMVSTAFAKIESHTHSGSRVQDLKTIAVFFSLTIFGMIFLVLIAIDANRLKNTIQVIGVTISNIALLVTAALEISQVRKALRLQDESGGGVQCLDDPGRNCNAINDLFPYVEKYLIVTAVIIGVAQIPLTILAVRLWSEWGWRIYKMIGADIKLRRYYLCYQILVVLLKFDFLFGIGFTMSYLILVVDRNNWEYGVTIAAVPMAVIILFLCAFSVRREYTAPMLFSITCFVAGGVYFVYKITRIYNANTEEAYRTVRLTMTFFSIFAILFLILTLINSIICLCNFGKGLREAHDSIGHVAQERKKIILDQSSIDGDTTTHLPSSDREVNGMEERLLEKSRIERDSSRLSLD